MTSAYILPTITSVHTVATRMLEAPGCPGTGDEARGAEPLRVSPCCAVSGCESPVNSKPSKGKAMDFECMGDILEGKAPGTASAMGSSPGSKNAGGRLGFLVGGVSTPVWSKSREKIPAVFPSGCRPQR
jgi:hypothetical protein